MEFYQDLAEFMALWDARESEARDTGNPQFHDWFSRYQARDAKEMLLYPIRRDLGLGYEYCKGTQRQFSEKYLFGRRFEI